MQESSRNDFRYSNSQRNNMHKQNINRDYGRKNSDYGRKNSDYGHRSSDYGHRSSDYGHRSYRINDFDSRLNITPINNHNRPSNFCNNNNVSNLSFNEEDFMSSTAYNKTRWSNHKPQVRFHELKRPFNNSFNDSSFTTKTSKSSKYRTEFNKKKEEKKIYSISCEKSFKKTVTTNNESLKKIETNNIPLKKTETSSNGPLKKITNTSNRSSDKRKPTRNESIKKIEIASSSPLKKADTTHNRPLKKIKTTSNGPFRNIKTVSDNRPSKKMETSNGSLNKAETTSNTSNQSLSKMEANTMPLNKTETSSNEPLKKITNTSNILSEKIKTTHNKSLKKIEISSDSPLKRTDAISNRPLKNITTSNVPFRNIKTVAGNRPLKKIEASNQLLNKAETIYTEPLKKKKSSVIKTTHNESLKKIEIASDNPLKRTDTTSNRPFRNITTVAGNRPLKKIEASNQSLKKAETICTEPLKKMKSSVIFEQGDENFSKDMNDDVLNFIIDPEAPTEDLGNNRMNISDYLRKSNLKFPEVKIPKLKLTDLSPDNIELLKNMKSAKSSSEKQASPKKLFKPNYNRLVSSPNVVQMKKDILCNELEIFQDDNSSIQSGSFSVDKIESSFSPKFCKPKNKVDAIQEIKPKTCIIQDKSIIVPSTQSQAGDFVHKGINMIIPDTQSQVFTPSLSIPCGQKRKETEINCLSPKKEHEDDAEHILNSFFSQIIPPILSQVIDPIREPEMDLKLVNFVSNHPKFIPASEPDNIGINNNPSISLDSVQSSPRISSLGKDNKSDDLSFSSQNDDEIVPSSQSDISSSIIVPNIQSLKLLSNNISRRTSLESSLNESINYSQSLVFVPDDKNNSYLGSTPPCTSTQISRKIKKFCLPDISPLGRNNFEEVISERFDSEQILINNTIIKQELNTQSFQVESDNILEYNTLVNDSVVIDSQTRNFEAIKIKMESLFDVEASQCTQELDSLETSNIEQSTEESMTDFPEEPVEHLGANENQEIVSSVQNIDPPVAENKETQVHISQEHRKKKMLANGESKEKESHVEKTDELKITVAEENVGNENDGNKVYLGSKNHFENNETRELEKCNGKEKKERNQPVERKKNENPEFLKRKLIEDYDSKVEDVVRRIRDVCEKKKNSYLQHNIPTQFEIRIKDIEGTGMSKEIIEFTLQDDEEELVRNTLSVSMKCKTGRDESGLSTQPFKVGKDDQVDDLKENVENMKGKKEKKEKKLDQPVITKDYWWEIYTNDIPKSIYVTSKNSPERTKKSSKPKVCVKTRAPEITPGTSSCGKSKTRKLSEESETEYVSLPPRKKLNKSKKIKKVTVGDLCDSESENEVSAPIKLTNISDDLPEANSPKKKKKKWSKEDDNHSDDELSKKIQDKKYKKELGKSLNKFYKKTRTLTPPFQFKKLESQPGKKWHLLSNFDLELLGT